MFVQATKCKRGNTTYFTYLIRESFRTPQGPRSRTICNITALPVRAGLKEQHFRRFGRQRWR